MEIEISFPGGKRVDAKINDFEIKTDQAEKYGGGGEYPEPFMYFLSSIGTCAGIYILNFCQTRDISTNGLKIKQKHEFIEIDKGKKKIGKIIIQVELPDDFPEKYRSALIRSADQCAVKRAILDPPEFDIIAN